MSPMSIFESQTTKTLTLLLQHSLSSPNTNHNLPRPPLLPDFLPSSAIPPPRRFLSSLLPQHVWSGKALSLKEMYANTWPDVSITKKASAFSGQEGKTGGSSNSKQSHNRGGWTNILIASHVLAYGAQVATKHEFTIWGAQIRDRIAQGQLYRLVTASFLHASIPHLMLNCYALYSLGKNVEITSGTVRFLAVYFISAVAGSAMSYRLGTRISVGSSGAISGLVAAYAVFLMRHRSLFEDKANKGLHNIACIIALNMLIAYYIKRIDKWAHVGGFLGGAAVSWFIGPALKVETNPRNGKRALFDRAPIFNILRLGRRDR